MFRVINPTKSVNFRYKNNQLFIDFESANKVDTISLNKNIFNNKCLKLKNQGAFLCQIKIKSKLFVTYREMICTCPFIIMICLHLTFQCHILN